MLPVVSEGAVPAAAGEWESIDAPVVGCEPHWAGDGQLGAGELQAPAAEGMV